MGLNYVLLLVFPSYLCLDILRTDLYPFTLKSEIVLKGFLRSSQKHYRDRIVNSNLSVSTVSILLNY